MIKEKNFLFLILLSLTVSCSAPNDSIKFESSQPAFENPISGFGKRIQGIYENSFNPDLFLVIDNHSIILNGILKDSCTREEIEKDSSETINLKDDTELIKYFEKEGFSVKLVDDSIFYWRTYQDTLFIISNTQILKKYKGDYYLNYELDDGFWNLKIIYTKKDSLFIDYINPSSEIEQYEYLSKKEIKLDDSTTIMEYILYPDKKEFKKLLNSGMVQHEEKYVISIKKRY